MKSWCLSVPMNSEQDISDAYPPPEIARKIKRKRAEQP